MESRIERLSCRTHLFPAIEDAALEKRFRYRLLPVEFVGLRHFCFFPSFVGVGDEKFFQGRDLFAVLLV